MEHVRESQLTTQSKLHELRDHFELILDSVYSGIIFCDNDLRIVFMNKVYGELLGTDRDQAVGKHITEFFPHSRLPRVLESCQAELGERCSLRTKTKLLVNRIPIVRNGEPQGIILQTIFKDFAAFRDLVTKLDSFRRELDHYKSSLNSVLSAKYTFDSIIGNSPCISEIKELAAKYAQTDFPVLILGPTGSGKELFAQSIHQASPRKEGSFVSLNCGAIPRELLESELFGYESGAFTGANKKGKPGKIELAHRGTLYLDEIGDLPLNAQAALLRVLETKTLERVGSVDVVKVNFRLIAATNRNLRDMIKRKEFREDLFYRLNTMTLNVPSLSERQQDIPLLVDYFKQSMGRGDVRISGQAMEALQKYPWPGNIRELKNVVERAVSLAENGLVEIYQIPPEMSIHRESARPLRIGTLSDEMTRCEKEIIEHALELNGGNMSRTAKALKISRSTLYEKIQKYQSI